ncbi:hypothetical protein ONE63_011298 [Megalurothrips usitatus]|uniref:C2H2-type domain-containing protein n=1 Tax=Megalurothrips usitatus TaxID=439358 RepID=A0AAV7WZK7_9NEOP|nr:hypothetical protein ONE63_011298 [Megalurothrips usitatus]
MGDDGVVLGIDLGASKAVAAAAVTGCDDMATTAPIPAVLFVPPDPGEQWRVGGEALAHVMTDPASSVSNVKRVLGADFDSSWQLAANKAVVAARLRADVPRDACAFEFPGRRGTVPPEQGKEDAEDEVLVLKAEGKTAHGHELWMLLEERGTFVPECLKNILQVNQYNSLEMLAKFVIPDDEDKIVKFMQQTLHQIIPEDEMTKYYDIFRFKPEKFVFVPGHQLSLKNICKLCKCIANDIKHGEASTPATPAIRSSSKQPTAKETSSSESSIITAKKVLDQGVKKYIHSTFPSISDCIVQTEVASDGLGSHTALLYCPVKECGKKIKIGKNNTRWNTSNFYTHLRSHFKSTTDKGKISTFFNSTSETPVNEDHSDEEVSPPKRKRVNSCMISSEDESEESGRPEKNTEENNQNF